MKKIAFLIAVLCAFSLHAQVNPTLDSTKYNDPQNMDVVYSGEAQYPAGEQALYQLLYEGVEYSDEAKEANIKDDLIISFDVNFDSTLTEFYIIHEIGFGIDQQVISQLKDLKFAPAVMNGIEVRQNVMLTLPIRTYPDM
ncbi:MAG: energy transducer TonB [Bacteroidales bacterium]|nr:energy transducer TonB [Bacteroidales bacterium]